MKFTKYWAVAVILSLGVISCNGQEKSHKHEDKTEYAVVKTEAEWKAELSQEEFEVLRKHSTERAFTGDLLNNPQKGTYTCAGCGQALFDSETKFKSGTGWPSFYAPVAEDSIGKTVDQSYGMTRTEVHCSRCGGHLGHVFRDGPEPTGLRYCINSVSLDFEKR